MLSDGVTLMSVVNNINTNCVANRMVGHHKNPLASPSLLYFILSLVDYG